MSRTYKDSRAKYGRNNSVSEKADRLTVIAVRRRPIDTKKLGQALLDLVTAQAQVDAEAGTRISTRDSTSIDGPLDTVSIDAHSQSGDRP